MTYDYVCKACEEEFVFEHSIKRKPRKKCPSCKRMKLLRLISVSTSVILKGDCWEKDGYASKEATKA